MSMIMSPVDAIAELFTSEGAADYLGEPVTVADHLLQHQRAGRGGRRAARAQSRRRCCTTSATCAALTPRQDGVELSRSAS